jgi:hypothetical protein
MGSRTGSDSGTNNGSDTDGSTAEQRLNRAFAGSASAIVQ